MISKKVLQKRVGELTNQVDRLSRCATERRIKINDLEKFLTELLNVKIKLASQKRILEKQLQCAAKGHNFVFKDVKSYQYLDFSLQNKTPVSFYFECLSCKLTIIRTKDELTPKEKKALKDLGILEDNGKNTSTTK